MKSFLRFLSITIFLALIGSQSFSAFDKGIEGLRLYSVTPSMGLIISNNGNVSIATSSVNKNFAVSGNGYFDGSLNVVGIVTANLFSGSGIGLTNVPTVGASFVVQTANISLTANTVDLRKNLQLSTNWLSGDGNNEGLFVSSNGFIGIGKTTPNALLNIAGTISANSTLVNNIITQNIVNARRMMADQSDGTIAIDVTVTTANWVPYSLSAISMTSMKLDQFDNSVSDYVSSANRSTYIKSYAISSNSGKDELALSVGTSNGSLTSNIALTTNYSVSSNYSKTVTTGNYSITSNVSLTADISISANRSISANFSPTSGYVLTANFLVNSGNLQFVNDSAFLGIYTLVPTADIVLSLNAKGLVGAMSVLSSGDVGIGVLNPSQKLDVSGSIRLRGATSGYFDLQATSNVAHNYTLRFPTTSGGANKVLFNDGAGNLFWQSNGGGASLTQWSTDAGSNIWFEVGDVRIQKDLQVTANGRIIGNVSANKFAGNGALVTGLNASNFKSGTFGYQRADNSILTTNYKGDLFINDNISANRFVAQAFYGTSLNGLVSTANYSDDSIITITANGWDALSNIRMNNYWLSNDGSREGVFVSSNGSVGIGITPNSIYELQVSGNLSASDLTINNVLSINALVVGGTPAVYGYNLNVMCLSGTTGTSGTSYYFGYNPVGRSAIGINKMYITKAGSIRSMEVHAYQSVVGTFTAWSMTIQKNGVDTAATVANPTVAGSECTWSISGLNIPVVVGDYLEMRFNCTWTIRPTTAYGGTIYIE